MEFKVGDRVTSEEQFRFDGDAYQQMFLEIVEINGDKVKCKYFLESEITPLPEYFTVSLGSLTFISHDGLKRRGTSQDPFFKR